MWSVLKIRRRSPNCSPRFGESRYSHKLHDDNEGVITIDDLRALAVHEAGHASCATNLGLRVLAIEINQLDGGFTFVIDLDRARPTVQLAVLLAGGAAEREFLGHTIESKPHDNSDQQRIDAVLALIDRRLWPSALAQARGMAQRMVRMHRPRIYLLADALLERCAVAGEPRGRLDGDALADLLGEPATIAILRAAARPFP